MNLPVAFEFGNLLRGFRHEKGKTLREIAAAAGMDSAVLSKIERGRRLPTEAQAASLARTFGIPETDLQAQRIAIDFIIRYGRGESARKALAVIRTAIEKYGADDAG